MKSSPIQTQDLIVVLSKPFYQILCDFYQSNDEFYMTRKQIGDALEYNIPDNAIVKIHERNSNRLDQFSTYVDLTQVEGSRTVKRNTIVYSLRGVMEICRFSRQPKADEFMDFVWDVMETLFRGEAALTPTTTTNPLIEQSLYHLQESQKYTTKTLWEHEYRIANIEDRLRLNDTQTEPSNETSIMTTTVPNTTYFNDVESLYQDMIRNYELFAFYQSSKSNNGTPMVRKLMTFDSVVRKKKYLEFRVSDGCKDYLDIYNIERTEKTVGKGDIADYKIYHKGSLAPIVIQAAPKQF